MAVAHWHGQQFVYLWADGIHVNVKAEERRCILVVISYLRCTKFRPPTGSIFARPIPIRVDIRDDPVAGLKNPERRLREERADAHTSARDERAETMGEDYVACDNWPISSPV